jgi:hypothetical protein
MNYTLDIGNNNLTLTTDVPLQKDTFIIGTIFCVVMLSACVSGCYFIPKWSASVKYPVVPV